MLLFASYSGAFGGAERLLVDCAAGLDGERLLACPEGALAQAARASGVRVLPLRARRLELRAGIPDRVAAPARLAAHARELRGLVAELDPDVVIAWGMRPAIACLLGRVGGRERPALVFQHNDFLPGAATARLVRTAAARAALVIAPSHAVADELDPGGRLRGRIEVVHPGVDAGRFDAGSPPATPPSVLVLGALVPWKRLDVALDACALARRRHPELRLRLVGGALDGASGPLTAELRARAAAPDLAGCVEFAGPVGDPGAELARATCLLHCAEREPFGIAVLEALAAGRPTVVPAAGGPVEIVDSSCARSYPPGDARAAADALDGLLSDPELAARMGAAGRVRAREQFDLARSRAQWAAAVARVRRRRTEGRAAPASLSLVTVTHNSAAVIGGLLESVERHLPGVTVVIVDNASADETLEIAREWRSARLVELGQNVGFGRACNLGVAEVRTPVTGLLNPDVELIDDSLVALAELAARPEGAERLLAPLVLAPDGSRQDTVHPVPTSLPELVGAIVPSAGVPGALSVALAPWRASRPRRVGWAVGCALIASTETLRRLGPFDERIFLYGEDLDLGLRAAAAGVQTWFWPSSRVVHHGAHSTGAAFGGEPFERLARARRAVVERELGSRRLMLDDAAQALTFASRIVAKRALRCSPARERRQLAALAAARRGNHA